MSSVCWAIAPSAPGGTSSGETGVSSTACSTVALGAASSRARPPSAPARAPASWARPRSRCTSRCGRRAKVRPSRAPARRGRRCRPRAPPSLLARSIRTWVRSRACRFWKVTLSRSSGSRPMSWMCCAQAAWMSISRSVDAGAPAPGARALSQRARRWCRSRAWSRPGCPRAAGQQVEGAHAHEQRQRGVEAAREAERHAAAGRCARAAWPGRRSGWRRSPGSARRAWPGRAGTNGCGSIAPHQPVRLGRRDRPRASTRR